MNLSNPYEKCSAVYAMERLAWEMFEQGRTLECSEILRHLTGTAVEAWINNLHRAVAKIYGDQP